MKSNYGSIILAISLFFILPASSSAAPGDLDPSFGSGGKVTTGVGFTGVSGIALQPDGKIVAVGTSSGVLARYDTDGSLDTAFGNGGIFHNGFNFLSTSMALQTDGRIITAGYFWTSQENSDFIILRHHTNGSLDTSFDGDGIATFDLGNSDGANRVVIQSDGKIVVIGRSGIPQNRNFAFAVLRLNPNGSLDAAFDGDGKSVITLGNFSDSGATAAAIQPDGKIVVTGESGSGVFTSADFALVRYNPDGTLDTSFDGDGKVFTAVSNTFDQPSDIAIQPDGKIVAAGSVGLNGLAITRYNPDGSLDISFDGDGIVRADIGYGARSLGIQTNGKIVVVGSHYVSGKFDDFFVARYNPNGSLDTTFGGGIVTTDFGNDGYASANSVAIQPDGKIVAAGSYGLDGEFSVFALARYIGDAVVPNRTPFDFDGDGRADVSVFRPSERIWYLNQSAAGFSATQFGLSTDRLTPADFDGDGCADISVYRDGVWYWLKSSDNSFNAHQFGIAADIPVPADFTGDGRAELAVYRGGVWWTLNLANNQTGVIQFGFSTDKPVIADYDGDGQTDIAVYRPASGEWWIRRSSLGMVVYQFGNSTDKPVQGDYTGDGKTDVAVFRPSTGEWFVLRSEDLSYYSFPFGLASDIPASADYDGDGKTDAAVYRNGTWYLRQTTNGISIQQFGLPNDKPIPAAYLP